MKTLVMFEAFGGKLRSEPEVIDIQLHETRIKMPLRIGRVPLVPPGIADTTKPNFKSATFEYEDTVRVDNWAHPIRKYVLVDI